MDLRLFIGVLVRFRALIAAGLCLAVLLSILSVATPSFSGGIGLEARQAEVWASTARILVTQGGFPQGRADINPVDEPAGAPEAPVAPGAEPERHFADQARLVEVAIIYARLARGDEVRRLIRSYGPIPGAEAVDVTSVPDLPMLEVLAQGTSRNAAVALAQRQTEALQAYLRRQQTASGVPPQNRLVLKVIEKPGSPPLLGGDSNTWIIAPRSMMRPVIVFLAIFGLFVGLAFVLENLRPRLRAVPGEQRAETLVRASGFPRT
jgi:hypothetical protein